MKNFIGHIEAVLSAQAEVNRINITTVAGSSSALRAGGGEPLSSSTTCRPFRCSPRRRR